MNEGENITTEESNINIDISIQDKDVAEKDIEVLDRQTWEDLVVEMSGLYKCATPECMASIKQAASIGASNEEIAHYAEISKQTLYNWQDWTPLFRKFIEHFKEKPILKARQTITGSLDKDDNAKWYLERKTRGEFANQQKNYNAEITNSETMTEEQKSNLNELLGL